MTPRRGCDLPDDSRTRRDTRAVRWAGVGEMRPVYCVSCHRLCGWTSAATEAILYECTPCLTRYGGLPLPRAPDVPMTPASDPSDP